MLTAGCHSMNKSTVTNNVCKSQIAAGRNPVSVAACDLLRSQMSHPKAAAVIRIPRNRSHTGHLPRKTSCPLENTEAGYLKRN